MFCYKCGSEISDGAKFCHKCGAKIMEKDVQQSATDIPIETKGTDGVQTVDATGKQSYISVSAGQAQSQTQNVSGGQCKEKKSKKKFLFPGAVILCAIIAIFIALNWNGKVDYVETVAKHTPFAVSQGLPYTYEEVLNQYLVSIKWEVRDEGDIHYVDISGMAANGADGKLDITIKVTPNPDNPDIVAIHPESAMLDGRDHLSEGETVDFLFYLFCLYDEGYEDLSVLLELENETGHNTQGEVSLTETFMDSDSGISFRYPAEWTISYPSLESSIVVIFDPESTDDCSASFSVGKRSPADLDPFGVFSEDEKTVRKTLNDYFTLLVYEDTMLGDVSAKNIKFLESDYIVTIVLYRIGEEVYEVHYTYTASAEDMYGPMFDAIMDSYTVSMAMPMDSGISGSNSEPNICFNDIPVSELLSFTGFQVIQMFGGDYFAGSDGDIVYDEIEFYMIDDNTVGCITSFYPENFNINGYSLDDGSGEGVYSDRIIDLLGPDYEEEYSDWYYITYHYPAYTASFSVSKYNEVGSIKIYSNLYEKNGLTDDALLESQEPIEYYQRLGGSYSASIGQSTLTLSIYSSQEEGEIEIGSAVIYADDGQYFVGLLIPIDIGTYRVTTDTGEEVLLIELPLSDEVVLELYVDGQCMEQYQMTEHYVP